MLAVRRTSRRDARYRRTIDGPLRVVSAVTPRRTAAAAEAHVATMRGEVRAAAEDRPGVYRMLSTDGEVLYIGKSKRIRTRLMSYFRCAYPEEKGARILREAYAIDWEYTPSEFAAPTTPSV